MEKLNKDPDDVKANKLILNVIEAIKKNIQNEDTYLFETILCNYCKANIQKIAPNERLFRARIYTEKDRYDRYHYSHCKDYKPKDFEGYDKENSGAKLKNISAGRCNAKNQRVLYASYNIDTCIIETRPQANNVINVAEIMTTEELNIINFCESGSVSDDPFWGAVICNLRPKMSDPFTNEDEYIFTRYVSKLVRQWNYGGLSYHTAYCRITENDKEKMEIARQKLKKMDSIHCLSYNIDEDEMYYRETGKNIAVFGKAIDKCNVINSRLYLVRKVSAKHSPLLRDK